MVKICIIAVIFSDNCARSPTLFTKFSVLVISSLEVKLYLLHNSVNEDIAFSVEILPSLIDLTKSSHWLASLLNVAVFVLFVYWGIFMNILYPYEENNDIMIKTQNMKNRKW